MGCLLMLPGLGELVLFAESAGSDRSYVSLVVSEVGQDLLVRIFGGTHPHIGAVAIGLPYPSQRSEHGYSASVSVYTLVGHKDDIVASWAADLIARTVNRITVVVAGIHIDNATPHEIETLVAASKDLVQQFISRALQESDK